MAFLALLRTADGARVAVVGEESRMVVLDEQGAVTRSGRLNAAPTAVTVPEAQPGMLCVATTDGAVTAFGL